MNNLQAINFANKILKVNKRDYFFDLRQSNLLMLSLSFILFLIIWVLAAGFGSPVAILAGFLFFFWSRKTMY